MSTTSGCLGTLVRRLGSLTEVEEEDAKSISNLVVGAAVPRDAGGESGDGDGATNLLVGRQPRTYTRESENSYIPVPRP